jgi:signal transduction histidine kinase
MAILAPVRSCSSTCWTTACCTFAGRSQGLISVTAELVEDAVLIRWQDDGCGIAEEHVASVFDPFYTTQLGQTGMGLGLASVHGMVVNLMKGQVSLESTPGQGTCILLRLPLHGDETGCA